jgi:NADH-quinone oxidoreductase subunit J
VGAQVFFLLTAAVAVGSALAVVLSGSTVHAALFLLLNLFALAALYLSLGADFLFAVQVIVYAGAIMTLFLFVITLLNPARESALMGLRGRAVPALALCGALLLEAGLLLRSGGAAPGSRGGPSGITEVGEALFTRYLFAFEAVSLLLLAAVIGAIVLAGRRDSDPAVPTRGREEGAAISGRVQDRTP